MQHSIKQIYVNKKKVPSILPVDSSTHTDTQTHTHTYTTLSSWREKKSLHEVNKTAFD